MAQEESYLTADEVVQRLRNCIKVKTLRNWRSNKTSVGPPFCRFGGRILYPLSGLVEWEKKRVFSASHGSAS